MDWEGHSSILFRIPYQTPFTNQPVTGTPAELSASKRISGESRRCFVNQSLAAPQQATTGRTSRVMPYSSPGHAPASIAA
ncbi:hypothetical protein DES53_109269 [Roseimicrobium gellanilyticum]|uniref:Uncharacterized protein n=1 Tax=Roseimicrobium gellanilyticum TaxID=748857 RepID=A0A366HBV1_9BACT|nr:hypothetical protein DES53_109269 [Roseimicrobium gellanilyticum]